MEDLRFDWLDADVAADHSTPGLLMSNDPRPRPSAEQPHVNARAATAVKHANRESGDCALPLLRLSNWDRTKLYDKDNPECIHYDFRWKVSQRERIRGRHVCSDTDPDLVLAPSDFWKITFEQRLETLLKDENRWPGDKYACEETNIDISIERSRQRGLKKRYKGLDIDWNMLDSHMEGLGTLFSKKRRITFGIEFVFKEVTGEVSSAKGKKMGHSATKAQKLQRAADTGLWTRVYKHRRCRRKYCKQGPHCWADENGNHHKLLPRHLEEIFHHIKGKMKEGEKEEEVEIDIEIPQTILKDVLDGSRKRKAEDADNFRSCKAHRLADGKDHEAAHGEVLGDIEGDRMERLEEYCAWNLQQVGSDQWRQALQAANQFALDQFLELNSILQHPKVAADLMVKGGVKPGIALQFVSSIRRFQHETEKT